MNILFFLTPKASCSYLYGGYTIRQAIERMESIGYAALPILSRTGAYRGSLTEGDLLWAIKNVCEMDMSRTTQHGIMEIPHRRDNAPVYVTARMEDLVRTATDQNFVPVVDDKGDFIGIVTRRAILCHYLDRYVPDKAVQADEG